MQRSIYEAEERLERKMEQHTERKFMEVHQILDALELRVLALPSPTVDVTALQAVVESLREDLDTILEARVPESEAFSAEPAKDTVLAALFSTATVQPPPKRDRSKRHRVIYEEESGRRSVMSWRLQGEPHLLMRRPAS